MKRFVIDCGNSSIGPVGFVARVNANSKKEALEIFRDFVPEYVEVKGIDHDDVIEYFNVYLNGDGISIKDVEEDEDEDED